MAWIPTAGELRDMIAASLTRDHGGVRRRWRDVLGPLRLHDRETHPHCNWSAQPAGSPREVEAVERLLDRIRAEHPIARP